MALPASLKKRLPLIVGGIVVIGLIVGGVIWWQGKQRWEATDNAFVQADTVLVSPRISGSVIEVLVKDNQRVEAGQVLARLDDADARAALAQAQANLAALTAAVANVDARALVEQAQLALDRTVIRAPVAGVVGARGVRVGQVVQAGGQMMSIVPLQDTYVVANFKETQVGRMRLGQTVEIKADAFPGQSIVGHVDSFAPATGSEFALIPVENATGNFTKITQRVPVRIVVDRRATGEPVALRPGLSVEVKVDLKSQGGAAFADAHLGEVAVASLDPAR